MKKSLSRRRFIKTTSAAAVAVSAAGMFTQCSQSGTLVGKNGMPLRVLGKTGEKISILGYGCGSQFMLMDEGAWQPHVEYAFEAGINYFDTASTYGEGQPVSSEERLGTIIPAIRKDIFLLTKIHERDPLKARDEFERSLARLRTDYVDVLLIHAILPEDEVSAIEDGVYQLAAELKRKKMVRYIGFSSMDSAEKSRDLLEKLDFDVTLLALNATNYGSFVQTSLPSAIAKNVGVISMKIMRNIIDKGVARPEELLAYNWNLPGVAVNLVSQTGMEPLKQNIEIALNYGKGNYASLDGRELEQRLAYLNTPETFDWASKGYIDGMIC